MDRGSFVHVVFSFAIHEYGSLRLLSPARSVSRSARPIYLKQRFIHMPVSSCQSRKSHYSILANMRASSGQEPELVVSGEAVSGAYVSFILVAYITCCASSLLHPPTIFNCTKSTNNSRPQCTDYAPCCQMLRPRKNHGHSCYRIPNQALQKR